MKANVMKKFFVAVVMAAMLVLTVFTNGLSAREKMTAPGPDDSVMVMGGAEKIKYQSGFFEIKLRSPIDIAVSERVDFEWEVRQTQALPGTPVTYIFLNGRKFALLPGVANYFTANLQPGEYRWQVLIGMAWNGGSHMDFSAEASFEVKENGTTAPVIGNYPNPFNPETTIRYSLPADDNVKLTVFDMLGREVATLVDGFQTAGEHQATWNASQLSSGKYFYRLESGKSVIIKMMTLLK